MKPFYLFLPFLLITLFILVPLVNCELFTTPSKPSNPQPAEPNILYGNIRLHRANGSDYEVGNCDGNVIHFDYTVQFNSIVAVCEKEHTITVNIYPLDEAQPAKLSANRLVLSNLELPQNNRFALDWSTGLLYFSEGHIIWVVDLKQPVHSSSLTFIEHRLMKVYESANSVTVKDLVVRPENSSLIWMEFANKVSTFRQSSLAGKDVARLYEFDRGLERLYYDYLSDRFLAIEVSSNAEQQTCFIFSSANISNSQQWMKVEINVKSPSKMGELFLLYGDGVIFLHKDISMAVRTSIRRWNTSTNALQQPDLVFSQNRHLGETFTLLEDGSAIRPHVTSSCKGGQPNLCTQSEDFCVPHNKTFYVCKSNPSIFKEVIIEIWILYVTGVAIGLGVLLSIIVGWVLTQKRIQFYEIKLKSMNRVNSTKLQAKSEAAEEVAE